MLPHSDLAHPVTVGAHVRDVLDAASRHEHPFRHWRMRGMLPGTLCDDVVQLPFTPAVIDDTGGKRDTHNATRIFCNPENRERHPACDAVAGAFQDAATVARLERLCGVSFAGSFLRVELCLDTAGFWLEPHTDIGAKRLTLLVYLSQAPGSEGWGTDLLAPDGTLVERPAAPFNSALLFVPGPDTWHGFGPRPIAGLRRSLIVNYVGPEWRARHELAFPGVAV